VEDLHVFPPSNFGGNPPTLRGAWRKCSIVHGANAPVDVEEILQVTWRKCSKCTEQNMEEII
jgi:hypothetical protein